MRDQTRGLRPTNPLLLDNQIREGLRELLKTMLQHGGYVFAWTEQADGKVDAFEPGHAIDLECWLPEKMKRRPRKRT